MELKATALVGSTKKVPLECRDANARAVNTSWKVILGGMEGRHVIKPHTEDHQKAALGTHNHSTALSQSVQIGFPESTHIKLGAMMRLEQVITICAHNQYTLVVQRQSMQQVKPKMKHDTRKLS